MSASPRIHGHTPEGGSSHREVMALNQGSDPTSLYWFEHIEVGGQITTAPSIGFSDIYPVHQLALFSDVTTILSNVETSSLFMPKVQKIMVKDKEVGKKGKMKERRESSCKLCWVKEQSLGWGEVMLLKRPPSMSGPSPVSLTPQRTARGMRLEEYGGE